MARTKGAVLDFSGRLLPCFEEEMVTLVEVFVGAAYQIDKVLELLQERFPERGFPGNAAEFTIMSRAGDEQYSRAWLIALIAELQRRGCTYQMMSVVIHVSGYQDLVDRFDRLYATLRPATSKKRQVSQRHVREELKRLMGLVMAMADFHSVCVSQEFITAINNTKYIRAYGLSRDLINRSFAACPDLVAALKVNLDARYKVIESGTAYDIGSIKDGASKHAPSEEEVVYDKADKSLFLPRSGSLYYKYIAQLRLIEDHQ